MRSLPDVPRRDPNPVIRTSVFGLARAQILAVFTLTTAQRADAKYTTGTTRTVTCLAVLAILMMRPHLFSHCGDNWPGTG